MSHKYKVKEVDERQIAVKAFLPNGQEVDALLGRWVVTFVNDEEADSTIALSYAVEPDFEIGDNVTIIVRRD